MPINVEELKAMIGKQKNDLPKEDDDASKEQPSMPPDTAPAFELDDDGEEYMPVGVDGVLAASEKLLAINRGLTSTDERDSLKYQKIIRPYAMLQKSIKMDAGKVARQAMYQAAKRKNLSGITSGQFDNYVNNLLVGNPLTSPLEEINPMQLTANARRITKMGPGGLGSSQSITEEAQAIHPSQFGFISAIEGPECFASGMDIKVFSKQGWVPVEDISMDTELACRIAGKLEFHKPERVVHEQYKGIMYGVKSLNAAFLVTPNHRFLCYDKGKYGVPGAWKTAEEIYGKIVDVPCRHEAYEGTDTAETIKLDNMRSYSRLDWSALTGYVLSSRCMNDTYIAISPSDVVAFNCAHLVDLIQRMGIPCDTENDMPYGRGVKGYSQNTSFIFLDNAIKAYYDKNAFKDSEPCIPEEIFEWPVGCRKVLLGALVGIDGDVKTTQLSYSTTHKKLAEDVERLMIGLGYSASIREEKGKRKYVNDAKYVVCASTTKYRHLETHDKRYDPYWYTQEYDGLVHCATVPGGMLFVSTAGRPGIWTGNSERAGIDVRAAMGTKIGTDGRLYQKFYDRRRKKYRWMSPVDVDGLVMKLPD